MEIGKKRRLLPAFIRPILLAAIPSVIVCLIIPFREGKFTLECLEIINIAEDRTICFDDLNGDGNSEKIIAFDSPNTSGVTIHENEKVVDQWNIRGSFYFIQKDGMIQTTDFDGDGSKEVYIFSVSHDSILLNVIHDIHDPRLKIKNRFIAKVGQGLNRPDPSIIKGEAEDLDRDGNKELIFGINTGFSKFPRQVYAYNQEKDSLMVSPVSSGFILGLFQADINSDGIKEILPYGYASNNIRPEDAMYHDHSAWLMVLDQNLQFMFEPVEFRGNYVHLKPLYNKKNGQFLEVFSSVQDKDSLPSVCGIDTVGNILYRNVLQNDAQDAFLTEHNEKLMYVTSSYTDGLSIYDNNKKLLDHINLKGTIYQMDVDLDGSAEIINAARESSKFIIYRPGLRHPAVCNIEWEPGDEERMSLIKNKGKILNISFQAGGKEYLMKYGPNSLYYLNYGIYAVVYLSFLGFVQVVQLLQKKRSEDRFAIEKKITDLQLSLLRNQLDPHFTLNALNSVIYSVLNSEKEKAVDVLRKFSNLYRTIVLSAGQSRRSLDDEITFCTEYLNLEKLRQGDSFDYDLSAEHDVDRKIMVPKMLIHFFAENAIKHAFKLTGNQGRLMIRISKLEKGARIIIEDNGIGRKRASELNSDSTGKGIEIMMELFYLYNKFYDEKISFETVDLFDENNSASGTRIIISIK